MRLRGNHGTKRNDARQQDAPRPHEPSPTALRRCGQATWLEFCNGDDRAIRRQPGIAIEPVGRFAEFEPRQGVELSRA